MVHVGEGIFYDSSFKLLICKSHGNGIHPSNGAIKRHLRGHGHRSKGKALAQVLLAVEELPLASLADLRSMQLARCGVTENLTQPIRHLRIVDGWGCVACSWNFLTTSLEVVQRHAAAVHGRKRGDTTLWEGCHLQTLFSETKDRKYFRVTERHQEEPGSRIVQANKQKELSPEEHNIKELGFVVVSPISDMYWGESDSSRRSDSGLERTPTDASKSPLPTSPPVQVSRRLSLPQGIVLRHPFMSVAEKYVPLAIPRLNYLLKSAAFRSASMPIFDSISIDTPLKMQAVFPDSEVSAVWANALLYATVQIMNRGIPTEEGQLLHQKTIQLMNRKLSCPDETLCSAAVGAIMVLKATAYKTSDVIAHEMHTQGLAKVMDYAAKMGVILTPAALKAIFWLDLNAAAHIGCERQMSHLDLPTITWRREIRPEIANYLPAGFVRHRDSFPYGLPECIADLEELQTHLRHYRVANMPRSNQFAQLEPMQAHIESRLAFQAHACRQVSAVAEAVRLALYICTYCSWMDTWNDSLLPCRLAMKVFELIESITLSASLDPESSWYQRIDLIFWLVFISSSAAELDEGQVESIKARRNGVLKSVSRRLPSLATNKQLHFKSALHGALNDYIYVDGWLERRSSIPLWHKLEQDINGTIH